MAREVRKTRNSYGKSGPRHPDRVLAAIAARQHGVVARAQLEAVPLSADQIEHRLRVGRLHRALPRVYAVGREQLTPAGRLSAAVLWAGPGAVVSHRSAAALWSMLAAGETIHVTTPKRLDPGRGLSTHRTALAPDETTTVNGLPVTTSSRTLLDIAALEGRRPFDRALRQAEYLQLADPTPLSVLVARYPGRRGTAIARAALAARRPPGHTESELEDRFAEFLAGRGIELPRLNAGLRLEWRELRVDCLWERQAVVVELDGRAAHLHERRREADAERDLALVAAGFAVARVTWRRLHEDPAGLERDLRALLARRRGGAP